MVYYIGHLHTYKKYIWIIPASSHVIYPYLLTGHFNPTTLYEINIVYPEWKYILGWILTFISYFTILNLQSLFLHPSHKLDKCSL